MSKKFIIVWVIGLCFLIWLFIMSSTDIIIKDKKNNIYQVAILVSENMEDYHSSLKKGIDKAASEYNVDVNVINTDGMNNNDIKDSIKDEIQDGIKALIVDMKYTFSTEEGNKKYIKLLDYIEELNITNIPIVLVGDESYGYEMSSIGIDYYQTGKSLFVKILERERRDRPRDILFYSIKPYDTSTIRVMQAFNDSIKDYKLNINTSMIDKITLEENLKNKNLNDKVLVAVDNFDCTSMVELLSEYKTYAGVYAIADSTYILNKMNEGIIDGIMTFSEYKEGYLLIKKAIDSIQEKNNGSIIIDTFYVDRYLIKNDKIEQILYPID